jgi:hypothetical protein
MGLPREGRPLGAAAGQPTRLSVLGDFTRWKEHDAYTKALDWLLRDLRVEKV